MYTFEVYVPSAPPGFPPLMADRLQELGPGETVDRGDVEEVCGTEAAAHHFLQTAQGRGVLVPAGWNRYRVPDESTLRLVGQTANQTLGRFIAWARTLPGIWDRPVTFLAPWLWRSTDLDVHRPMPVLALDPDAVEVPGAPPQWEAFHMDLDDPEPWKLAVGDADAGQVHVPTLPEAIALLRTGLVHDARWREAILALDAQLQDPAAVREVLAAIWHVDPAPRGNDSLRTGKGPPYRRRLLAPDWYMDHVRQAAVQLGMVDLESRSEVHHVR